MNMIEPAIETFDRDELTTGLVFTTSQPST